MEALTVLDLFSGIGGFSLGLERTGGFRTVAFCEINPFCRKVLAKHWPDVPCHEDITMLKGEDVGPVDVVCGGFPCQPFSLAGERRGASDDRHLWPEMVRVIAEVRPTWVIGENVVGLLSMGIDSVLSDLEALGYEVWPVVIPAAAIGAPHRRNRVWIVAYAYSQGPSLDSRLCGDHGQELTAAERGDRVDVAADASGNRQQGAEPLEPTPGLRRRSADQNAAPATDADPGRRWPWDGDAGGEEEPRRQGWGDLERRSWFAWESAEPALCRVDDGVPAGLDGTGQLSAKSTPKEKAAGRAHRISALGNSVVPQIPEMIGHAIMRAMA